MDFAIRLVSSVLKLPDGQVTFLRELKSQKNCNQTCSSKIVFVVVETTFGPVLLATAFLNGKL